MVKKITIHLDFFVLTSGFLTNFKTLKFGNNLFKMVSENIIIYKMLQFHIENLFLKIYYYS